MTGHKKGEDVLNNFVKTIKNARTAVEQEMKQADTRFAFATALKRSESLIQGFSTDQRITRARAELRASRWRTVGQTNIDAPFGRSRTPMGCLRKGTVRLAREVQASREHLSGLKGDEGISIVFPRVYSLPHFSKQRCEGLPGAIRIGHGHRPADWARFPG